MSEDYTVQQGDCISSIAYEHGFFWQTLWNHGANASVKSKRKDPNVLMKGDLVHIPDLTLKEESSATEKKHKFKLKGVPAKLRLRLLRDGKPRKNESYTLIIDGKSISGKTDGDGWIKQPIPPNAKDGKLLLCAGQETYDLQLGHLAPHDEVSGIQGRLSGLGFYAGAIDGQMNEETAAAISKFQRKNSMAETGQIDESLKSKLKSAFGS